MDEFYEDSWIDLNTGSCEELVTAARGAEYYRFWKSLGSPARCNKGATDKRKMYLPTIETLKKMEKEKKQ